MASSIAASVADQLYAGGMQKPEQMAMPSFKGAWLNVNGTDLVIDGDKHYQYKVPFAVQLAKQPCCTRMLWCCCPCCCPATGPQDAMDFINQDSGDQVRFHRIRRKVHVFHNGQHEGYLKSTCRCCGNCRTCCDEVCHGDVPMASLYDKSGGEFAKLSRPGRGCCCDCHPNCPCRCIQGKLLGIPLSLFVCCGCTCEAWPSYTQLSGCGRFLNGLPTCGLPHGCLYCNPVCCDCCIRGSSRACGCLACPVLCCPNPCGCLAICCLCPTCSTKELPIHSTFKYEELELTKNGALVGQVQLQYRGNVPFQAGFMHDESQPHAAAVEVGTGGSQGLVASALLIARSYALGAVAPMLDGLAVASSSPDFDGYVVTNRPNEVDTLLSALDADNRVTTKVLIGPASKKINLQGYTLVEIGYDNAWCTVFGLGCGGGESKRPKSCTKKTGTEEIIKNGRAGGTRPTFKFRFYMEDPEIDIISRKNSKLHLDSNWYDFYHYGREQVYLTCSCIRFCKFPCDCTRHKTICCKCPLYQRDRPRVAPDSNEVGQPAKAPNQVIMRPGKKVVNIS